MLICDGHAHLYPRYDLTKSFDCLISNLRRMAPMIDAPPILMACLAERAGMSVFANADFPLRCGQYEILSGPETACLTIKHTGDIKAYLIMGRQFAAAERIEVMGLAMTTRDDWDGLPAREIIVRVRGAGGLPVLPWAPGKWFFGRGRLVAELAAENRPGDLWLGDTALRPGLWPLPRFMCPGGIEPAWIPGSDPLPLKDEESRLGSYGFVYDGEFDAEHPVSALRNLMRHHAADLIPAGRRGGMLSTACRILLNYRQAFTVHKS